MLTTGIDEFTWTYHHQLAFELLKTLIDVTNQYLSQQPQQPQHPDQLNSTSGKPQNNYFQPPAPYNLHSYTDANTVPHYYNPQTPATNFLQAIQASDFGIPTATPNSTYFPNSNLQNPTNHQTPVQIVTDTSTFSNGTMVNPTNHQAPVQIFTDASNVGSWTMAAPNNQAKPTSNPQYHSNSNPNPTQTQQQFNGFATTSISPAANSQSQQLPANNYQPLLQLTQGHQGPHSTIPTLTTANNLTPSSGPPSTNNTPTPYEYYIQQLRANNYHPLLQHSQSHQGLHPFGSE